MAICPNCGNQTGEGAVFCDQCGTRLPAPEAAAPEPAPAPAGGSVICPACGAGNVPGEAFCDYCGSPLEAPVPTAEPVPELEPVSREAELEVTPAPAAEEPAGPVLGEAEGEEAVTAAEVLTCPACGANVQPDEAFCPNCGASLAQPPIPPELVAEAEPAPEPQAETVVEEAPPPPAPAAAEVLTCPACGAEVEAGDAFCSSCGALLQTAPTPAAAPVEAAPVPPPPPPAGLRLVVAASGAEIPLPAKEEILIGREDPVSGIYPAVDLTPHGGEEGGVSRQHARLIVEGGNYFIEDLDSTNFTFVNKQKLAPKIRQAVNDGDEIRCGRVALVLKTG